MRQPHRLDRLVDAGRNAELRPAHVWHRIAGGYIEWVALFRRSWHSAAVTILSQSLVIATVALASRGLGATGYGNMVAIGAYYGWFSLIAIYTTHALIPRIMTDPDYSTEARAGACAMAFWLTAGLTVVATLLALACLPLGAQWFNIASPPIVAALYAVVFAASFFNAVILNVHQAAGWLRQWSFIGLLGGALPVILLMAHQLSGRALEPLTYVALLLLASLFSAAVAFGLFVRNLGGLRRLKPDLEAARPLLQAGRGPWVANFSGVLATFGISTLLAAHLTKAELAHYDVVLALHMWAGTVVLSVTVPAMADFSRLASAQDYATMKAVVRRRQWSTTTVQVTAAVVVFLLAEPILTLLYGPEYSASAPLLRILVLAWPMNGLGGWYWFCLFAIRQAWRVAPPNLAFGLVTFGVTFVLLNTTSLGATGAVIARVAGLTLWFIVYEVSFQRALRQVSHFAVTSRDSA